LLERARIQRVDNQFPTYTLVASEKVAASRLGGCLESGSPQTAPVNRKLKLRWWQANAQGSNLIATASGFQRQLSFSITSLGSKGLSANFPANFARFENPFSAGLTRVVSESSQKRRCVRRARAFGGTKKRSRSKEWDEWDF
jgi:hypothetical protein